ncbi:MAG: tetratricopeptide repeat protein [Nitrospinota bacterium]|nr:tetratricopeptide repeat protein [Nitrospinota bacterium]
MRKFIAVKVSVLMLVFAGISEASFTKINKIALVEGEQFSSVVISFDEPAMEYSIDPNLEDKVITIVTPQSGIGAQLDADKLADKRVEKITVMLTDNAETITNIYLKDFKTSVYHSLSTDKKDLTIRLKNRAGLLAVDKNSKGKEKRAELKKKEKELLAKVEDIQKFGGKDLYTEGMMAFQKNKFDDAEIKLTEFIRQYPDSKYQEKAMFMLAETVYRIAKKKNERIPEAINAFRLVAASFPSSMAANRAKMRIANLYIDQGLDVEALAIYKSIIESEPEGKFTVSALTGRANIYLKNGDYALAYNELEKILLLYPEAKEVREARFKIAEAFYFKKRYKTALKMFEDSNLKWPSFVMSNPDTLFRFADTYYQLNKFDEAMDLYVKLINLFPNGDEGRASVNRLADIYVSKNQPMEAMRILGIQARKIPELPHGLDSRLRLAALGHAPKKLIEPKDALIYDYPDYFEPYNTYNHIIKKHPNTPQSRNALFQKAKLLNQEKRYIESILALKKMMVDFPDSQMEEPVVKLVKNDLYELIHGLHEQEGFYTILATYYDNFDPFLTDIKDANVMVKVADAYSEMGLNDKALARFEEAERLDRQGFLKERIRLGKGTTLALLKRYDEAEETLLPFADLLDSSIHAPEAVHTLGDIYLIQKKNSEAMTTYVRAISLDQDFERVSKTAYYLGLMHKARHEYKNAITYFEMAVDKQEKMPGQADQWFVVESRYQLIESAYLSRDFDAVQKYSTAVLNLYPDDKQNSWVRYVRSDSQLKLSQDENATAELQDLVKGEPLSVYGRVASATLENIEWKLKHKELFAN